MIPDIYAVLDVATTGLNPGRGDRAIEIGIVLVSEGEETDTFSSLINPGIRIDADTAKLTGISNQMLTAAPSAQEVLPQALQFIGDAQLVAHNANFAKKFWRYEIQRAPGAVDEQDFICTHMLSRRIFQSFCSYRLDEITKDLAIETNNNPGALNAARMAAQVLSVLLGRLRVAHSGEFIDGRFLRWYQQKSLSSLPDLTTKYQTLKAGNITGAMVEEAVKGITLHSTAKTSMSDNASRAAAMNADAMRELKELKQLLDIELVVDRSLDWDDLANSETFHSSVPRRPFIIYGDEDMPSDIEYLSMPTLMPDEPVAMTRPVESDFTPGIGVFDKLVFREQRLLEEAANAFSSALKKWESDRQQQMAVFVREKNQWLEDAKAVDMENDNRYQQCVEDQAQWWEEKQLFEQQNLRHLASIEQFKQAYIQQDVNAVERYVHEVLSRTTYPDYFPDELTMTYEAKTKTVEVRICLILPDDLPRVASVSYVKTQDGIKTESLSDTARNALYGNVVRSVCLRILGDVLGSDTAEAVECVIVNGYVKTVDLSADYELEGVIASVLAAKEPFLKLRQERLDAPSFFEKLGGRGTSQSLPRLNRVVPFSIGDIAHSHDLTV